MKLLGFDDRGKVAPVDEDRRSGDRRGDSRAPKASRKKCSPPSVRRAASARVAAVVAAGASRTLSLYA